VTEQPLGKHDPLLPKSPYRQHSGDGYENIRLYQTPDIFSPNWQIDLAYGTVALSVDASRYPEEKQICSTRDSRQLQEGEIESSDNDNIVIPPSGVVSPKEFEDDTLLETQSDVSERKGLATASPNTKPIYRSHDSRWVLPRRRDIMGRPRMERKNTPAYHVLRHPRKNSSKPCNILSSAVSASGDISAIAGTKSAKHTSKKGNVRCEYPDVLHAFRHPSIKTRSRNELCLDESGDSVYMVIESKVERSLV